VGRGAFFLNTVSAAPYTAASHASYFTGQYPLRHGVAEFYQGRLSSPTLFTYGRRAGRRTILKVDFPIILGDQLGFTADIDTYLVEKDQEFIDAVVAADTSVACAHFGGVHAPYGFHSLTFGGAAYREKVAELELLLPKDFPMPVDQLTETYRDPEDAGLLLRYKRVLDYLYMQRDYGTMFGLYLEGIEYFLGHRLEPFLAQLTERVKRAGKSMLLVVFADHGHDFGPDSYGHFNSFEEGVLRVPVIMVGDGVEQRTHTARVRTVDIAPTVLEMAGLRAPATGVFDGSSLADVVRGDRKAEEDLPAVAQAWTSDSREFVTYQKKQLRGEDPGTLDHVLIGEVAYAGRHRVVRRHLRYTKTFDIVPAPSVSVEWFDDQLAPRQDSVTDPRPFLDQLDDYASARRPPGRIPGTEEVRSQLRSLGYPL
jgi:choline-sulfatase